MIGIHSPKLSEYDPFKGAEGTLDPLGILGDALNILSFPRVIGVEEV